MKKIAMLAVVFAFTLAAVGCGASTTSSKGTLGTGGGTTPSSK